jgi:hypothetical protein
LSLPIAALLADLVAIPMDVGMRSVVGPLLIGLSLLLVAGCALPERKISRAEDLGFREQGRSRAKSPRKPANANELAFKASERKRNSSRDEAGTSSSSSGPNVAEQSEFLPGHSSGFASASDPPGQFSTRPKSKTADKSLTESDPESLTPTELVDGSDASPKRPGTTDASRAEITEAANRSNSDRSTHPIQLQGLEVDDPLEPTKVPGSHEFAGNEDRPDRAVASSRSANHAPTPVADQIEPWGDRTANLPMNPGPSNNGATPPVRQTSRSDPATGSATPAENGSLPVLPWQAELEQLITRVERDLVQSKPEALTDRPAEQLRKQAHLRLLYLMAQRQEQALTAIPGAEPAQQEYWQQMIWAMSNSFDTLQFPDPGELAAQTVPPLSAALRQMREQAALSIKNMTFCRKISYFGNYEQFPRNEFTPGHEVLLYTEIENFVSTPTVDGEYRTSLKSMIEIADSRGKVVWTKAFPSTEDFCRNPRRDYFHNYQFYIPEDLAIGAYSLKLTIVDELSHKRATNSLNFVLK